MAVAWKNKQKKMSGLLRDKAGASWGSWCACVTESLPSVTSWSPPAELPSDLLHALVKQHAAGLFVLAHCPYVGCIQPSGNLWQFKKTQGNCKARSEIEAGGRHSSSTMCIFTPPKTHFQPPFWYYVHVKVGACVGTFLCD